MEETKPKFWSKDEDAIIIDSVNKRDRIGDGLEFALSRLPGRILTTVATRFYDEARKGSYDGKIHNSRFKKLREKQKLGNTKKKKKFDTTIKVTTDEVLVSNKKNVETVIEEQTNIHLEVKKEEELSFIVQGTTSLGGIPLRAKFRITGQFTVDILPLDE